MASYRRTIKDKKIRNLFQYFEKNIKIAEKILPQLLKDENVAIRVESAGHCLALGIHISQAEEVLKNVMINKENGIFRLNAEMTVK